MPKKVTKQEITMEWRGVEITIPKGTRTTHQTACGYNENYNFVNEYDWLFPEHLRHDAIHYGIDIPADLIETID